MATVNLVGAKPIKRNGSDKSSGIFFDKFLMLGINLARQKIMGTHTYNKSTLLSSYQKTLVYEVFCKGGFI